jgi:hypothetical protein
MNLYTAKGQKLEDTILSLLDRPESYPLSHFYNNMSLVKTCPDRKRRGYGTLRTKKGHST